MGRSPRIVSVTRTSDGVGVQQMSLGPDGSTAVIVDDDLERAESSTSTERSSAMCSSVRLSSERGNVVLDAVEAPDGRIALSVLEDRCDQDGSA